MTTTDNEKIEALKTGAKIMNSIAHPEIAAVLAEVCNDLIQNKPPEFVTRTPQQAIDDLRQLIKERAEVSEFGLDFVDEVETIVESVIDDDLQPLWDENGDDLKHPEPDGAPFNYINGGTIGNPSGSEADGFDPDYEQAIADKEIDFSQDYHTHHIPAPEGALLDPPFDPRTVNFESVTEFLAGTPADPQPYNPSEDAGSEL